MKTATFVRKLSNFRGDARLYRIDPPMPKGTTWDLDAEAEVDKGVTEYVVVSAVVVDFGGGPETYIFAADESGEITDWMELPGSYKGGLNHAKALDGAGYEVTR